MLTAAAVAVSGTGPEDCFLPSPVSDACDADADADGESRMAWHAGELRPDMSASSIWLPAAECRDLFGTGTASDKLLSTFLASVSCFPLSTICWAPTAESTACSVLARAGSFLPASLVLEDRLPAQLDSLAALE